MRHHDEGVLKRVRFLRELSVAIRILRSRTVGLSEDTVNWHVSLHLTCMSSLQFDVFVMAWILLIKDYCVGDMLTAYNQR